MTLPGFRAETSLYKTSVHYRSVGALVQADRITPQQLASQWLPRPCGPCHLDAAGACVRNCTYCFGIFPRECFTVTEFCPRWFCPLFPLYYDQ